MSRRRVKLTNRSRGRRGPPGRGSAVLFAALGDDTRLGLMLMIGTGAGRSITQLAARTRYTRQAVTKHLRVLESAGLVRRKRRGRETLFEPEPGSLDEARRA